MSGILEIMKLKTCIIIMKKDIANKKEVIIFSNRLIQILNDNNFFIKDQRNKKNLK